MARNVMARLCAKHRFVLRAVMWRTTVDHRASQRVVMVGVNDASDVGASEVDVDVDDGFEVLALGLGA